jgi:uncharacterized membrane protein (UPF0127 family)
VQDKKAGSVTLPFSFPDPLQLPTMRGAIQRGGTMLTGIRSLAACAALIAAAPVGAQQGELPAIQLSAGVHLIRAELANTYGTRMQGLMFRKSLAPNSGMLFDFEQADIHCMWMKNTLIPLSVAFIDDKGEIINIADMKPQTEQTHCARRPARYALEMSKGWFAARGIRAGQKLRGLEKLAR